MSPTDTDPDVIYRTASGTIVFVIYKNGDVVWAPDVRLKVSDLDRADLKSLYLLREVVNLTIYDKERQ